MPRTAKLDTLGVLHHVMIRGIEGRKIFRNNKDREDFIERLARLCPEMQQGVCYVFGLRENWGCLIPYWQRNWMSIANIGLSVERGELIAKEDNYSLEK